MASGSREGTGAVMPGCCLSPGKFFGVVKVGLALSIALSLLDHGTAQAMRLGNVERAMERTAESGHMPSGIGRIECLAGDGAATVREATGWILAAADTVVTAAHTLFPTNSSIDPRACLFRLFNSDGSTREVARVRYMRSPWSEIRYRNDSAHDVAVLKLERAMDISSVAAIGSGAALDARPVRLISYPDSSSYGNVWISSGEARPFPLGPVRDASSGMRVSDPSRLFASSVESEAGSSGGLYYSARSGTAIGIHIGYVCGADTASCFNFGLRFDRDVLALIASVAADAMPAAAPRIASIDFPKGMN